MATTSTSASASTSTPASLTAVLASPDTYGLIVEKLLTPDLLSVACTCSAMKHLCEEVLGRLGSLQLRGTDVGGAQLLWLAARLGGACRIDVADCENLTKANITQCVAACPALTELVAMRVGPGSWSAKHVERLLAAAPPSLRRIALDCRVEMKNDLREGSELLGTFSMEASPLHLERLTLIADNLPRLLELDASSGALGVPGSAAQLLSPLLSAGGCALRSLSCTSLERGAMAALAPALKLNTSLTELELSSNLFTSSAAIALASAIEGHPSLTRLSLDHNPILDRGGVALAKALPARLSRLSLAFTGVGDATCDALRGALATPGGRVRSLNLTGNRISEGGTASLSEDLGSLTALNLTANLKMDGQAAIAMAKALPGSALRQLRLAGCGVDKRACSRLAAALLSSELLSLDLSANHFGDEGSDEFAWVLSECDSLTALDLADCGLGDEAADELLEALPEAPALKSLDLRWNKLGNKHQAGEGISAEPRVLAGSQKLAGAAERAAKARAAAKPGKKAYVPKWMRGQLASDRERAGN